MDVQEKRARYREIREKALGTCDKATAEGRQLTEAEQTLIEEGIKEGKQLAAELQASRLAAPPELSYRNSNTAEDPVAPANPARVHAFPLGASRRTPSCGSR